MLRTFNCGIGMILICSKEDETKVLDKLKDEGATVIGNVIPYSSKKLFLLL